MSDINLENEENKLVTVKIPKWLNDLLKEERKETGKTHYSILQEGFMLYKKRNQAIQEQLKGFL